jgi:hypothetical protein
VPGRWGRARVSRALCEQTLGGQSGPRDQCAPAPAVAARLGAVYAVERRGKMRPQFAKFGKGLKFGRLSRERRRGGRLVYDGLGGPGFRPWPPGLLTEGRSPTFFEPLRRL